MIIIIIVVIILVILGMFVSGYNGFVQLKNSVEEAFSTMDVYLKKRWDLIPNILESVKGYSAHESKVLTDVINLRKNNN